MQLRICHLYPDLLNLYGDRGNLISMKRRLETRGIGVRVEGCFLGQPLDIRNYDIFFIGGGQDMEMASLLRDLPGEKSRAICRAVEEEQVFVAVCGGYQILGQYYRSCNGRQLDFTGAVDLWTIGGEKRLVGNFLFRTGLESGDLMVTGFENHSGRTYLGEGVRPLGQVIRGYGNNGKDRTEGARYKNVFATYAHGAVLPKNPALCDLILSAALQRRYGRRVELEPLDDTMENRAHDFMESRLRRKRKK